MHDPTRLLAYQLRIALFGLGHGLACLDDMVF
jgi:hypothetical protein